MKKLKFVVGLTVMVLAIVALVVSLMAQEEKANIRLETNEVSLGKINSLISLESLIVSPDSKRVTYVAAQALKQFAVVNGEEGKEYDKIGTGTLVW